MDGIVAELSLSDELLVVAAKQLRGAARRVFLGQVCQKLCGGNTRKAEKRFGWGRETIAMGIAEQDSRRDSADTRIGVYLQRAQASPSGQSRPTAE